MVTFSQLANYMVRTADKSSPRSAQAQISEEELSLSFFFPSRFLYRKIIIIKLREKQNKACNAHTSVTIVQAKCKCSFSFLFWPSLHFPPTGHNATWIFIVQQWLYEKEWIMDKVHFFCNQFSSSFFSSSKCTSSTFLNIFPCIYTHMFYLWKHFPLHLRSLPCSGNVIIVCFSHLTLLYGRVIQGKRRIST